MKVTIKYTQAQDALPVLAVASFITDCSTEVSNGSSFEVLVEGTTTTPYTSSSEAVKGLITHVNGNDAGKVSTFSIACILSYILDRDVPINSVITVKG